MGLRQHPGRVWRRPSVIPLLRALHLELIFETHKGLIIMRKNISIALTLLALIGVAPLLAACNTTAGVGRDISDGGHAITHDANSAR